MDRKTPPPCQSHCIAAAGKEVTEEYDEGCVKRVMCLFFNQTLFTFSASGKLVILLLFNAGPLDITWAKLNTGVYVIIECFFPAQATGEALARTFMNQGEAANPAARLPATWPTNLKQVR